MSAESVEDRSQAPQAPGAGDDAPSPASGPPRRGSDRLRLTLAFLTGSLLTAAIFLTIMLVRSGPTRSTPSATAAASVDARQPSAPAQPKGGVLQVPDVDGRKPGGKQPSSKASPLRARRAPGLFGRGADPFAQIDRMMQRMHQRMQRGMRNFGGGFTLRLGGNDADLDVREEPDAVIVTARVKDAVAGKFDIKVNGRQFTLRGQRRIGGGAFQGVVSFSQSVSLPADVDPTGMTSKFENGVLRVRLPKKK